MPEQSEKIKRSDDKVTPITHQEDIKQQAGEWLVLMDKGALSDIEKAELKHWVSLSGFHKQYLQKLAKNWDTMDTMAVLAELFPLPERESLQEAYAKPKQGRLRRWLGKITEQGIPIYASSAIAASVLVVVVMLNAGIGNRQYSTAVGELASYQLDDGTTLMLNTDSSVKVNYTDSRRVITLKQGEVNFDVAKDKTRPFVVYAGDGMVWAVGTAFNVRVANNGVDVTVTEGTVKVFADIAAQATPPPLEVNLNQPPVSGPGATQSLLKAGQAVKYSQVVGVIAPVAAEQLEQKLAWQQGALVFNGETLEQVIQEISRYTDKKLLIVDSSIKDTRVGGHYKTGDIDKLLLSISVGFDLKIQYASGERVLISSNVSEKKLQP